MRAGTKNNNTHTKLTLRPVDPLTECVDVASHTGVSKDAASRLAPVAAPLRLRERHTVSPSQRTRLVVGSESTTEMTNSTPLSDTLLLAMLVTVVYRPLAGRGACCTMTCLVCRTPNADNGKPLDTTSEAATPTVSVWG